jgi:hypothetical protein
MRVLSRGVVPVAVALWALATGARAQDNVSGAWQAGATTMDVAIESWGPDCGPRPQSTRSAGGGRVQVEVTGDVLVIKGRDRDVRSDRCWGPNPKIKKVGASHNKNTWITRCKTPAADPQQESATYTLRLEADGRLLYEDVSHFDWKLKASTCVATITTRQTLQRAAGAAPAPSPAPPATGTANPKPGTMPSTPPPGSRAPAIPPPGAPGAKATPTPPPCVPGKAARLSLRPRSAAIELGQRTCFEARVSDAKNCPLTQPAVSWSLDHKPGIRARLEGGCFRAEEGSAEGEGEFRVTAALGALRASATVEVSASTLPALIARRLEGGAIEGDAIEDETSDGGVAAAPVAKPPPTAVAVPKAPAGRVVARTVAVPQEGANVSLRLAAIAAGVLAFAVLFAFTLWRMRPRRPPQRPSVPSEPPAKTATMSVRSLRCPRCGAFYPEGSAFCGNDGSALEPTR